jgi:hypothetical protein
MTMINLIFDNKTCNVEEGTTILEAAKQINIRFLPLLYGSARIKDGIKSLPAGFVPLK